MKKLKVASVAVASVMACGLFAACDLTTTDPYKDYEQVIAEVDISKHASFAAGGEYAAYADVIDPEPITKRDMVAMFVSNGSSVMSQYGWTYRDTFAAIADSLVNRQVYIQYAKIHFLTATKEDGSPRFTDEAGAPYTVEGYKAAVSSAEDKSVAGLAYFLTDDEEAKALYDLRVSFNRTIDSQEQTIISNRNLSEDDDEHDETVRTTPSGIGTEAEDFWDPAYRIYTGTQTSYGCYEPIDDSTSTTRREAYAQFLSSLRSSGLLAAGEDTSAPEELSYFKRELKNAYEDAVIEKMSDSFEDVAAELLTDADVEADYLALLGRQKEQFEDDSTTFDSAIDSVSDTSFLLTAPKAHYGYVINILLPFNDSQTEALERADKDADDTKGNKFVTRANILKTLKATDQRGTWFTGEEDYSFVSTDGYTGTLGNSAERKYLFFEDSLGEGSRYERLKKYAGHYTYNGTVTETTENGHTHYTLKPRKIDIGEFIDEMEGYLCFEGLDPETVADHTDGYFDRAVADYYKTGEDGLEVDWSQFVYYEGKVNFTFDANKLFSEEEASYKAFSVINELSFAYNTDTAGLNPYLGYSVTPDKTSFVNEFEYAAQIVCERGAGNYMVVPSDHGWHIVYCTFSFAEANEPAFVWDASAKADEGTFSYAYYEALKSKVASNYASIRQTEIINTYAEECAEVYEDAFEDLSDLDNRS